jgi:hypothetical protein
MILPDTGGMHVQRQAVEQRQDGAATDVLAAASLLGIRDTHWTDVFGSSNNPAHPAGVEISCATS